MEKASISKMYQLLLFSTKKFSYMFYYDKQFIAQLLAKPTSYLFRYVKFS